MEIKTGSIVRIKSIINLLSGIQYDVRSSVKNEYMEVEDLVNMTLNYKEEVTYVGGILLTGKNKGMFVTCELSEVEVLTPEELQTVKVLYVL